MDQENHMFYYPAPISNDRHVIMFMCDVFSGKAYNVSVRGVASQYFAPSFFVNQQLLRIASEHTVARVNVQTGQEYAVLNSTAGFRRVTANAQAMYNLALGNTLEVFNLTSMRLQSSFTIDLQQSLFVTGALLTKK